jgi:hypothetical protein
MMQRLLTKYGLVLHIAFIVLYPVLFLARQRVFDLVALLWLSLVALELMVLLPSVRKGETLSDARLRVLRALVSDPLLYIGLAIVAVVLIQWGNSGCELVYLPDADVWQFSNPPVAWAPFSVETRAAGAYVSVFSACLVTGLVLRVAVSKGAKRLLIQGLSVISGGVALSSVLSACQGIEPFAARALGQGATPMGTFFGFWLLLGVGSFVDALARCQRGTLPLFLFGVVGNLLGMLFFASSLVLFAYAVITILLFIYAIIYLEPHVAKHVQFKLFLSLLATVVGVSLALIFVFPENPVVMKIKAAFPLAAYWDARSVIKAVRTSAAVGIWQEHPWIGVGADGFYHFAGLAVASKDWGLMKADPAYVYSDALQFLCEFGVLGAGLLLSAIVTLLVPICYRARVAWEHGTHDENEGRFFLLRISPIVLAGVLAVVVCFLESWIANPFQSFSLLLSWTCVMSIVPSFLPSGTSAATRREK